MYQKINKRSGVTLIELLISILLFSAITGASALMLSSGLKIWSSSKDRLDIRQNGSLAMERMIRYLEIANYKAAVPAFVASANSTTFAADVDDNGIYETVTLAYDAVNKRINITIGVGGMATILTPDVQSFDLSYYKSDPPALLLPLPLTTSDQRDSIRVVTISLTMNKGSDTVTLSSSAFCRNQGVV